jgi:hypothetical protein
LKAHKWEQLKLTWTKIIIEIKTQRNKKEKVKTDSLQLFSIIGIGNVNMRKFQHFKCSIYEIYY